LTPVSQLGVKSTDCVSDSRWLCGINQKSTTHPGELKSPPVFYILTSMCLPMNISQVLHKVFDQLGFDLSRGVPINSTIQLLTLANTKCGMLNRSCKILHHLSAFYKNTTRLQQTSLFLIALMFSLCLSNLPCQACACSICSVTRRMMLSVLHQASLQLHY
jgi:hypothetical protein